MADNKVEKTNEEVPVCEKDKKVEKIDEVKVDEKEDKCEKDVENGEVKDNEENGKEVVEEKEEKSCVKRKSAGGDAPDGTPAEEASPEKKQKLEEPVSEAEPKGATDVAA